VTLFACGVALATACSDRAATDPGRDAGASAPLPLAGRAVWRETPVELDLASSIESVWIDREFERLVPGPRQQFRFTSGWYRARATGAGTGLVESKSRASVVELPIAEIAARRLQLDLQPLNAPKQLPKQVLRILFNGHEIGRPTLAWAGETVEVDVPETVQQLGLNRLRIEPLYWTSGAAAGVSKDDRPIGITLTGLRLVGGADGDAPKRDGVRVEEGAVLQEPGAIFAWYVPAPDGARLRAKLAWQGVAPTSGHVRVMLETSDGAGRVVAEQPLAELAASGGIELDVDLGAHRGSSLAPDSARFVGLHAAVSPGAGEGVVRWEAARVVGTRRERTLDAGALRDRFDVLVLLFDTLRADHLEPYGNDVVKTPHLQALADSGFTFAEAGANATWTRPSAASLWTGLHPSAHRVKGGKARLPEGVPYLPAILGDAGWLTVGVSNNANFSASFGFARGFAALHEFYGDRADVVDAAMSADAQAEQMWSRFLSPAFAAQQEKPVFAVVHEIDPHSPYEAPEPFSSLYDFGYEGNIDGWNTGDLRQGMRVIDVVNDQGGWLGEADRRAMRAAYMAEVSFVDAYVGALLERLDAAGRRERTLVVMVSDHGEQFFEHGGWGHGRSVYQEEIEVPLILSLPGVIPAGRRSNMPVELVDLAPTILDLVGVDTPDVLQGRSLLPEMLAGPAPDEAPASQFATSNVVFVGARGRMRTTHTQDSIRLGRWKLHRRTKRLRRVPIDEWELYDLERDPEEVLDLWPTHPVVGHALKQALEAKIERDRLLEFDAATAGEIAPDVLENLRGLGYID